MLQLLISNAERYEDTQDVIVHARLNEYEPTIMRGS